MNLNALYRAMLLAAALLLVTGCGSTSSHSSDAGCGTSSGSACATVQAR